MEALARRAAAPVFALALFSSAALIFALQPLFAHMVTPLLGGSPSVWNASMAFFQGALLVGYLYAHLLARLKDLRVQAVIHALVLTAAWLVLPVRVSDALGPPNSNHPALWLLGVLSLSVGAPFAAASATAPLLQSWYARTGRADAHDPYYLYAASNLGSFIGLLAYPALIEPLLGVHAQSIAWSAGYVLVAVLIAVSASAAIASNGPAPMAGEHTQAPSWKQRLYWMAAAAAPSALVLGVTLHISTDVASAPLLWVLPLALYLTTFVIAFSRGSERIAPFFYFLQPGALALLALAYFFRSHWAPALFANLLGFFVSAQVCHLALARTRPHADRLTEFYFWVSLGGVLGGAFAAFVAPVIFNNVYEYPLALAAAALFRPRYEALDRWRISDASAAAAITIAVLLLALVLQPSTPRMLIYFGAIGAAAAMLTAAWADDRHPRALRFGFLISAILLAILMLYLAVAQSGDAERVLQHYVEHDQDRTRLATPWNLVAILLGLSTLMFVVHAMAQERYEGEKSLVADIAMGVATPLIMLTLGLALGADLTAEAVTIVGLCFCALALLLNFHRPIVLAALVLASFAAIFLEDREGLRIITQQRGFFGVLRTLEVEYPVNPPLRMRTLMNGTTIHGAQLTTPPLDRLPLTYYNPRTALGESILAGLNAGPSSNLALIGLGTGTTACLMRPTDHLTIYEINPQVIRLSARPGGDFTYVQNCQPHAQIELGDARLRIAHAPDGAYDVIVVDAFTSDAIPAHLLTREALALYLRKTSSRGIVVLHLSNRNLALVREAARVARDLHAATLYRVSDYIRDPNTPFTAGYAASVMIVARSPQILARLPLQSHDWRNVPAPPGRAWSDDYINLSRALWENFTGAEECVSYPYLPKCQQQKQR
ncbi:MAG TPA: fused MFS/spermidine synthase [Caulobacterales bacterium]|nr:fused MFS/spermidine synthase [Caulobacterales bacterium]